jgi:aconitate hydratase
MGNNLAHQLIADHLVQGEMRAGEEIALKIDQFLLHDMTGPLCALQLEAMGVEQICGDIAVAYCDHLLVEADSKNADDHILLQSAAWRFGMWFSRPVTAPAIPFTSSVLGFPGKHCSARIRTRREPAESACSRSARAGSRSPWH